MAGRPTLYSDDLAQAICDQMAEGMSVREIGRRGGMPEARTIHRWVCEPGHPFCQRYNEARKLQAQAWADECLEISDEGRNDWIERRTKDGETSVILDREHVSRSNLRVETRKWLLGKLHPGMFADRTGVMGPDGNLVDPTKRNITVEDTRAPISTLIASAVAVDDDPSA